MASADDIPQAIQWHEGMLLAPQHFQQQAHRGERLLHYHLSWHSRFHYGIGRFRIDQSLLFEGTLRVLDLEAILPDGLVVSYKPGEQEELQVDIRPHAEAAKNGLLLVYLAVAAERQGAAGGEGDLQRYFSTAGEPVADEHSAGKPLRIPRLKPRIRLIAGSEAPSARFCYMPLCGVRWKNGAFVLSDYIGPHLQVALDSPLGELCAQVTRRIREKAMYLVETIRSPAITTKPNVVEDHKRLINHLVTQLPSFEALLHTSASHPFELYCALCALAGSISAVGSQLVPPIFPVYDHTQIRRCFDAVRDYIVNTIEEGISEAFTAIPFKFDSGNFQLNFEREWQSRLLILGLKAAPGMTDQQLTDWMASSLIG
jgi:type VI secretion system protein ImpJ